MAVQAAIQQTKQQMEREMRIRLDEQQQTANKERQAAMEEAARQAITQVSLRALRTACSVIEATFSSHVYG